MFRSFEARVLHFELGSTSFLFSKQFLRIVRSQSEGDFSGTNTAQLVNLSCNKNVGQKNKRPFKHSDCSVVDRFVDLQYLN